jgi:hypothetical protein
MTMKKAASFLAGCTLVGCATVHTLVEPPVAKGPIASLDNSRKLLVYILKIDGKRVFDADAERFEFPPGIHTLSLRFHAPPKQQKVRNGSEFDLSFEAKAKHQYRIEFTSNADYSKWSAHVQDLDTHSRVSSIITDND